MQNLPLDVLRTFVAVADVGGMTQAGERVGRSQPAVSLQIKRLEKDLAAPLFYRQGHQLELTALGEELYGLAEQLLGLNDSFFARLQVPAVSGSIRFGIPSEFATTLLPKVVGQFAQAYPNVALEVVCDLSKSLLSKGRRDEFDLILALHDDPQGGRGELVKEDELVWVAGKTAAQYGQGPVPLVVAPEPCIYRSRATRALGQQRTAWQLVYTISDLTGLQTAIEAGLGATVLARSVVPANLQILRPGGVFPALGKIGISLHYDRRRNNAAVVRLAEYVRSSLG